MARLITTGVSDGVDPPPFDDEERRSLEECLGRCTDAGLLCELLELRGIYLYYLHMADRLTEEKDAAQLREDIQTEVQRVLALFARTADRGKDERTGMTLRTIYGREFADSFSALVEAAIRVRDVLAAPPEHAAHVVNLPSGHAAGLRALLWYLDEPLETGKRRGETYGLHMGAPEAGYTNDVQQFLGVITMRPVTWDDVRYARHRLNAIGGQAGNYPSGFPGPVTSLPNVW
jgi:hypothetical protein